MKATLQWMRKWKMIWMLKMEIMNETEVHLEDMGRNGAGHLGGGGAWCETHIHAHYYSYLHRWMYWTELGSLNCGYHSPENCAIPFVQMVRLRAAVFITVCPRVSLLIARIGIITTTISIVISCRGEHTNKFLKIRLKERKFLNDLAMALRFELRFFKFFSMPNLDSIR